MSKTENNIVVFFDAVGRTILGEKVSSTDTLLTVKNPAVVHVMPNQQSGQLQLQILPLFFKEFLAEKDAGTTWEYKRESITEAVDVTFDFKLKAQYEQIFQATPAQAPAEAKGEPEVIKLFDE